MSSLDADGDASGSSVWKLFDSNPCGYSGHLPRHFFRESWGDIVIGEQCISPVLVTCYCAACTLQIPYHKSWFIIVVLFWLSELWHVVRCCNDISSWVCCLTDKIKWHLFLSAKHLEHRRMTCGKSWQTLDYSRLAQCRRQSMLGNCVAKPGRQTKDIPRVVKVRV